MQQISEQNKVMVSADMVRWYLLVLAGAGVLYFFTCAPTILWQDSALFVYRIWHNDIQGHLGLAPAHPLYIMIGIAVKYIPFGDLAYKINLISAVFGALTIANLFLLLRLWLGRNFPAIIAAVTLALSWTFWMHAVIAEAYTLYTAQFFGELIFLFLYIRTRRIGYLYLLGVLNGLAVANHLWASFGFACYAVFLIVLTARRQIRLRHLCITALLWLIGAAPYEYLIIKNIIISGDVMATLASAAFGNSWQQNVLNTSVSVKMVLENIIFILLNFPTPNLLLLFVGLAVLRKISACRSFANIILALLVLHFVFAFRYTVPDRHVFFLPFYCIAAVLIGLGADVLLSRYNNRLLISLLLVFTLLPVPAYWLTPELARKFYKPLGQRRQRPYRDEYTYFLQPWKNGYRGAERFAGEALDTVEENAIIYAYTTDVHALLYMQQVRGKRSDVRIVSNYDKSENAPVLNKDTVAELTSNSSLYVVCPLPVYCPQFLLERYKFEKAGIIFKAVSQK